MSERVQVLSGGRGRRHQHVEPQHVGAAAYEYRWNTVVRTPCGHRWVRRFTWVQACLPLSDRYPIWKRLRPWHIAALVRMEVEDW